MTFEEYKVWVKSRVNLDNALIKDPVALGAFGLAGESGEVVDVLKKSIFHGKGYSPSQLQKLRLEMGDTLWYFALLCHEFNITLDELIALNVEKLNERDGLHGEKFVEARG